MCMDGWYIPGIRPPPIHMDNNLMAMHSHLSMNELKIYCVIFPHSSIILFTLAGTTASGRDNKKGKSGGHEGNGGEAYISRIGCKPSHYAMYAEYGL